MYLLLIVKKIIILYNNIMSRYDYSIISIEQRKLNEEELNNELL